MVLCGAPSELHHRVRDLYSLLVGSAAKNAIIDGLRAREGVGVRPSVLVPLASAPVGLHRVLLLVGLHLDRCCIVRWRLVTEDNGSHLHLPLLEVINEFILALVLNLAHLLTDLSLKGLVPLGLNSLKLAIDQDEGCVGALTLLHLALLLLLIHAGLRRVH